MERRRWRRWGAVSTGIGVLVVLSGCANQDPEGAAAFWSRLSTFEYRQLPRPPGYEVRRASEAIHAAEVDLYVNQPVLDVLTAEQPSTTWPEGSMIVKDGWNGDELKLIAAMEKRGGEWYWVEFHADGGVAASGAPAVCVGCHRAGDDHVRAFRLPR